MGIFSRLIKDTAIYGISSIVARTINFFFVPLYTRMLGIGEYGIYIEIFGYIALLQVVLTFGLETGFFRYASHDEHDASLVFSTILRFLFTTSLVFFAGICFYSGSIAYLMGYFKVAVIYTAAILAIDCFTAVLFAKLRYERKALKFAIFRTVKILSEVGFNIFLFFVMPGYFVDHPDSYLLNFIPATPDYRYILAAVFGSCVISLILFIPEIIRTPFRFSMRTLKTVLLYSLPLMIAGIPGVANDFIDRILFRFFAPDTSPWLEQLGIFGANTKLAVIMMLFVQMFRYAAEPFFFASSNQPNVRQVYADVMRYFTAFCMVIFVFVMMYIDAFSLVLGKDFRSGVTVVPIMLIANLLLGINQNLSMWYKLYGKTNMALIVTLSGLGATLCVDIIFMPLFGNIAAASGHLVSYTVMVFISYRLSLKYYPIPYQWGRLMLYIFGGVILYLLSLLLSDMHIIIKLLFNTVLLFIYIFFVLRIEHISIVAMAKQLYSKICRR
ncbi:MAG: oligosaccharide flippase family protein [Prevotellaceae bacterium]|nr:oligosaccharide flippase family protein [Prevotellaceae bacterium]